MTFVLRVTVQPRRPPPGTGQARGGQGQRRGAGCGWPQGEPPGGRGSPWPLTAGLSEGPGFRSAESCVTRLRYNVSVSLVLSPENILGGGASLTRARTPRLSELSSGVFADAGEVWATAGGEWQHGGCQASGGDAAPSGPWAEVRTACTRSRPLSSHPMWVRVRVCVYCPSDVNVTQVSLKSV